jgi:hypothetical protein
VVACAALDEQHRFLLFVFPAAPCVTRDGDGDVNRLRDEVADSRDRRLLSFVCVNAREMLGGCPAGGAFAIAPAFNAKLTCSRRSTQNPENLY